MYTMATSTDEETGTRAEASEDKTALCVSPVHRGRKALLDGNVGELAGPKLRMRRTAGESGARSLSSLADPMESLALRPLGPTHDAVPVVRVIHA